MEKRERSVSADDAAFGIVIESSYATLLGVWSETHYSALEGRTWLELQSFYKLLLMFAIPFALWWWGRRTR